MSLSYYSLGVSWPSLVSLPPTTPGSAPPPQSVADQWPCGRQVQRTSIAQDLRLFRLSGYEAAQSGVWATSPSEGQGAVQRQGSGLPTPGLHQILSSLGSLQGGRRGRAWEEGRREGGNMAWGRGYGGWGRAARPPSQGAHRGRAEEQE